MQNPPTPKWSFPIICGNLGMDVAPKQLATIDSYYELSTILYSSKFHNNFQVQWVIPQKSQTDTVEDILFWKPPWNFKVFYFSPGNSRQNKDSPPETPQKLSYTPWKF